MHLKEIIMRSGKRGRKIICGKLNRGELIDVPVFRHDDQPGRVLTGRGFHSVREFLFDAFCLTGFRTKMVIQEILTGVLFRIPF